MSQTNNSVDAQMGADPSERRLLALVGAMSLEDKVRLVSGDDMWATTAVSEIGLRRIVTSDGPAGVRGDSWDERFPSANVPSPVALGASWDKHLVKRIGGVLAAEARAKNVDVVLAPTVNLQRSALSGRYFEYLSEDPVLSGLLGAALVAGLQESGVGACVKHFVANDSEDQRFSVDVRVSETALRENYLLPFELVVAHAKPWSLMAAYNAVNGVTMTENTLLQETLKTEWKYDGVVISDWYATRTVEPSATSALDLAMPGPDTPWNKGMADAIRAGRVAKAFLDDKVLRILRLATRVGALAGSQPAAKPEANDDICRLLQASAAAGFVLAKNEAKVLPVLPSPETSLALIGPGWVTPRTLGGGSATVYPADVIRPLDAAASRYPESGLKFTYGTSTDSRVELADPHTLNAQDGAVGEVSVRYLDAHGSLLHEENRAATAFTWMGDIAPGISVIDVSVIEIRATAALTPGSYIMGGSGVGRLSLVVNGDRVAHGVTTLPEGADPVEGIMRPPQISSAVSLHTGQSDIYLRFEPELGSFSGNDVAVTGLQLNICPQRNADEEIDQAVDLARKSDVAFIMVGTSAEVESEGFDRTSLRLPGRQNELVARVAAANPRTVVIVNAGAPVEMPWIEHVAGVLVAWFPGQEYGPALADVLSGVLEPGGRFPSEWPAATEHALPTKPRDGRLEYEEETAYGYRRQSQDHPDALFPFGFGLGYSDWEFQTAHSCPDELRLEVKFRNVSTRRGTHVVQVYVDRGPKGLQLCGFTKIVGSSGEVVSADIDIEPRALRTWNPDTSTWTYPEESVELLIGSSALDIHARINLPADRARPNDE